MPRWSLAGGIFFRLTMQGAGYGLPLGMIYGALSPVVLFILSSWPGFDFSYVCLAAFIGSLSGGFNGGLAGFALGILATLVVTFITLIAQPSLTRLGLYRPVVRIACIATVSLGLWLTSIWFHDALSSISAWLFWLGLPSLIAAGAFWRIGGSVAIWVEMDSGTVIAGQG